MEKWPQPQAGVCKLLVLSVLTANNTADAETSKNITDIYLALLLQG